MNFEHTATSANLSTLASWNVAYDAEATSYNRHHGAADTSWTSPTSRHCLYVSHKHVKTSELNALYLKEIPNNETTNDLNADVRAGELQWLPQCTTTRPSHFSDADYNKTTSSKFNELTLVCPISAFDQAQQLRRSTYARKSFNVQQYTQLYRALCTLNHRWTETSQQQQIQKWVQDVSAYEMIHPAIDDALKVSTVISILRGTIQQHQLTSGSTTSYLAGSTSDGGQLPLPTTTRTSLVRPSATWTRTPTTSRTRRAKARKGKGQGKIGKGEGYNNNNNDNNNNNNNYYYYCYCYYYYNPYNSYYNQQQQHQQKEKGKVKREGPIGSYDNSTGKGKNLQKCDRSNNKGRKGQVHFVDIVYKMLDCGKLIGLAQQPKERQQHPATTATTTTSTVSGSGHIRSTHLLHASRGHHYLQLLAATSTATTSSSIPTGTTSSTVYYICMICDKSAHTRTSHLRHQLHQQRVRL